MIKKKVYELPIKNLKFKRLLSIFLIVFYFVNFDNLLDLSNKLIKNINFFICFQIDVKNQELENQGNKKSNLSGIFNRIHIHNF
jgi:hypothetical protein